MANTLKDLHPEESYKWNDAGFAQLFADLTHDTLRFNRTAREWFAYTGKAWKADPGALIAAREAKKFQRELLRYAAELSDDKLREMYIKAINRYSPYGQREALIRDARECFYMDREDLDRDNRLFNVLNGTLNLQDFSFHKHRASDLLTKIAGVNYAQNAQSCDWIRFLDDIMEGNQEKIGFLQRWVGYSLGGTAEEECCLFELGRTTRNGKGTLNYVILKLFGDYGLAAQPETLAQRKFKDSSRPSGDIARLDGCRFLNISEPPKNMLLDAALLKALTGRDLITARHLNEREFTFLPRFALTMNMNYLPFIDDDTLFGSGRIMVLEFTRHFKESEQDKTLKNRLTTPKNLSGILNWSLEGLKMYRAEGLNPPSCVIAATDEYRQSADEIGLFISECLTRSAGNISAGAAYVRYCEWCKDNGFGSKSKSGFFMDLKQRNMFNACGTVNGKTAHNVVIGYCFTL